ncbi:MAG: hypothetical protein RBR71_11000 [Gudongella sp.]|nr:hypothetical protein [Gudongella sp.]
MKKIFFIGEMVLMLILLLGCSVQDDDNYRLINEDLVDAPISQIEIETGVYKKIITNQDDLAFISNFLNDIQISDNNLKSIEEIKENNIIRFRIYNSEDNLITSISISKDIAFYENKWHSIDTQTYDRVISFYENSNYEELRDSLLLNTKQRSLNRKEKTMSEALMGTWLSEDDTELKFDKDYLYQGGQYEHKFNYNIDKSSDNDLEITVYGIKGVFIKGSELSKLELKMDETKTCMIMKKTMAGGMTYHSKLIYVDEDSIRLGAFDTYFFYEYDEY